jgi:crossover junction endodeoxyribonuclease RuvC
MTCYNVFMKLIAIDPGYGRCGVAVLEGDGSRARLIFSTCIETPSKADFTDRLITIAETIKHLIETHNPELFVIEGLFFSNNKKTALQVAEVRGVLLYIGASSKIKIRELHPNATKMALTGYGKATKAQMMFMVEKLIDIPDSKRLDDEFDAIALGLSALAENEAIIRMEKYS